MLRTANPNYGKSFFLLLLVNAEEENNQEVENIE